MIDPMNRPLTVVLDLTARCNLKCVMCHFATYDRLYFQPFDLALAADGSLPVEVFETIAADLFPKAWRVALACSAEPMIHPRFREILAIAGRYGVPDLWFPTNLLALTEPTAQAIVAAGVRTVAASIDGITRETYEKIRVQGKWDRLMSCLDLFNSVKRSSRSRTPGLRIIFTWMQSNRGELAGLPAFAEKHGAEELDVRFVSETPGVDVSSELLSGEDPHALNRELAETAREAVRRGLKLSSYPEFESPEDMPTTAVGRFRRRRWRIRAGLDRPEYREHAERRFTEGCAYPGHQYVIRPNGAVNPCIYWAGDPIGFYPAQDLAAIASGPGLTRIREGLRTGRPVGTCDGCDQRGTLYRLADEIATRDAASPALPAHPG